jgi:hypothetical protein
VQKREKARQRERQRERERERERDGEGEKTGRARLSLDGQWAARHATALKGSRKFFTSAYNITTSPCELKSLS